MTYLILHRNVNHEWDNARAYVHLACFIREMWFVDGGQHSIQHIGRQEEGGCEGCGVVLVTSLATFEFPRRRFMDNQAKVSLDCISCYLVS